MKILNELKIEKKGCTDTMEIQALAIAKLYRQELIFNESFKLYRSYNQISEAPERIFDHFLFQILF